LKIPIKSLTAVDTQIPHKVLKKSQTMKQAILLLTLIFVLSTYANAQTNEYDYVGKHGEIGTAWALVKKDNKVGCIDAGGHIVVPLEYEHIGKFAEIGTAWALVRKDKKYGCINTAGEIVVPVEYQYIGKFGAMQKPWAFVKKDNKYGCIATDGNIVVPIEYKTKKKIKRKYSKPGTGL
jgi:hypothetical protein